MLGQQTGTPGVGAGVFAAPRQALYTEIEGLSAFALPIIVTGSSVYNKYNLPYWWVLYAGTPIGRLTNSATYAPAIIGLTSLPLGGASTTLQTDPGTAAALAYRIGQTGTLTLTGANVAGGTCRSLAVAYSAVNTTTGAITITATASAAVNAVNQINDLVFVDNTGVGTFNITVEGITTGAITYSSVAATLYGNINTALNATFGTSAIVASGASLAAIILTFSGTGYAGRPVGAVTTTVLVNAGGTTFTINGVGTVGAATVAPVGTAGVTAVAAQEGEFVAGSMIQSTDGSQTPLLIVSDTYGVKFTDWTNVNVIPNYVVRASAGGLLNASMVPDKSPDPATWAYFKSLLPATLLFSDTYGY
jgi:hypothetical protein